MDMVFAVYPLVFKSKQDRSEKIPSASQKILDLKLIPRIKPLGYDTNTI